MQLVFLLTMFNIDGMKKNLLLLLFLISVAILNAQIKIPVDIKKTQNTTPKITGEIGARVFDVTVFESPNFQGRSGYFKWVNNKLIAPFPTEHISFKIPDGKIVYIKTSSQEFSSEKVFTKSQADVSLGDVTGIRSDNKTGVLVEFDGISTSIHNNDCKKVFGNITVQVVEVSPTRDSIRSSMPLGPVPGVTGRQVIRNSSDFIPFKFADANSIPEPYYRNYIYDNKTEPVFAYNQGRNGGILPPATGYFIAGENALREGRVKIIVSSDLGSAHKSCDLCVDFSSNIRMKTRVTESVPLNIFYPGTNDVDTTGKKLVFGPYQASGSKDGNGVTATAVTTKQFRAYFKVKFYQ